MQCCGAVRGVARHSTPRVTSRKAWWKPETAAKTAWGLKRQRHQHRRRWQRQRAGMLRAACASSHCKGNHKEKRIQNVNVWGVSLNVQSPTPRSHPAVSSCTWLPLLYFCCVEGARGERGGRRRESVSAFAHQHAQEPGYTIRLAAKRAATPRCKSTVR